MENDQIKKCGIPDCKSNGGTQNCVGFGCQWIHRNGDEELHALPIANTKSILDRMKMEARTWPDKKRAAFIQEAFNVATLALNSAFEAMELKDEISGTCISPVNGNEFELTFRLIKTKPIMADKANEEAEDLSGELPQAPATDVPQVPGPSTADQRAAAGITDQDIQEDVNRAKALNPDPHALDDLNPEMQAYIGCKILSAAKMSLNTYQKKTGKIATADDAPGYFLEYEDGYQSWSPADVFERCYRLVTDSEKALCF